MNNVLEWPNQSTDLNSIENQWHCLKIQIQSRDPKNIQDLKTTCEENKKNTK